MINEVAVEAEIVGQFGVEGGGQQGAIAHGDGFAVECHEDVDVVGDAANAWGADKDGVIGGGSQLGCGDVGLEGVDLATEGVAVDGHGEQVEGGPVEAVGVVGKEDGPGAGPPEGKAILPETSDRFVQVVGEEEAGDGGAFAAGDDEAVEPIELVGVADFTGVDVEGTQTDGVLAEVALEGEDADGR